MKEKKCNKEINADKYKIRQRSKEKLNNPGRKISAHDCNRKKKTIFSLDPNGKLFCSLCSGAKAENYKDLFMISRLCFEHVCTGQAVGKNLSRWRIFKLTVDPIGAAFFFHFSYIFLEHEETIQVVTGL